MRAQYFIVLLLIISGWWVYFVYEPFMQDITISILLMFATLGISKHLSKHIKKRWQISAIMTLFLGAMFFAPLVYLINEIATIVTHIDPILIQHLVEKLANYLQSISLPTKLLERLNIDSHNIHTEIGRAHV